MVGLFTIYGARSMSRMCVRRSVANFLNHDLSVEEFLVGAGAIYTVIPKSVAERVGGEVQYGSVVVS